MLWTVAAQTIEQFVARAIRLSLWRARQDVIGGIRAERRIEIYQGNALGRDAVAENLKIVARPPEAGAAAPRRRCHSLGQTYRDPQIGACPSVSRGGALVNRLCRQLFTGVTVDDPNGMR